MIRMVIAKTRQFSPARKIGSVSRLGSPFPSGKGSIPASRLQTVFSITQSDHSLSCSGSSVITDLEMPYVLNHVLNQELTNTKTKLILFNVNDYHYH